LLNDGKDRRQVAANECSRVELQAREDGAAQQAVGRGRQSFETSLLEHEPLDLPVQHAVNDVFSNAIAAIGIELIVQIVAGAARSNLGD